jgi:adenosylcobinamide kinase/adenosylcobinamide-phosphate guanylyltransferase
MRMPHAVTPAMTLVLGGARSGKSSFAERLVQACTPPWIYIATAQAFDDEMRERVATHRERRPPGWTTLEAPLALGDAIRSTPQGAPVLVDCLTLWLTNLILSDHNPEPAIADLLTTLDAPPGPLVLVANEVGLGIVPDNALARRFRDLAGRLHQHVAAKADRVVFMVAGLPMAVK